MNTLPKNYKKMRRLLDKNFEEVQKQIGEIKNRKGLFNDRSPKFRLILDLKNETIKVIDVW